jgi:hypothetical protein
MLAERALKDVIFAPLRIVRSHRYGDGHFEPHFTAADARRVVQVKQLMGSLHSGLRHYARPYYFPPLAACQFGPQYYRVAKKIYAPFCGFMRQIPRDWGIVR